MNNSNLNLKEKDYGGEKLTINASTQERTHLEDDPT